MNLYQVVLNKIDDRSPIFQTREEAQALVRKYATYMKRRGCQVIKEEPDHFSAIWGGWSEHQNIMWIREIQVGKIPDSWTDF